jgi:hypothetical protein
MNYFDSFACSMAMPAPSLFFHSEAPFHADATHAAAGVRPEPVLQ